MNGAAEILEKSYQTSITTDAGGGGASRMHGLHYQSRCRLCRLSRGTTDEQALLAEVHELRARGIGARSVASHIAGKLEALGLTPVHGRSVRRHDKHIVRVSVPKPLRTVVTQPTRVVTSQEPVPGEFGELVELLERLIARIRDLDDSPEAFSDANGRFDPYRLAPWTGLINSARSAIESLHKLRQSDLLMNEILKQNMLVFARGFAAPLGEELRSLLPLADREVAGLIQSLCENKVPGFAESAGRHALADTRRRYKIAGDDD